MDRYGYEPSEAVDDRVLHESAGTVQRISRREYRRRKKEAELREVYSGVFVRRKDSQKFVEDLLNAGSPVWIWIERISALVTPVLVLFVLGRCS